MKIIKYFFEFIFIISFFIFKIIGYKNASILRIYWKEIGPFFRSKSKIKKNLNYANICNSDKDGEIIIEKMWGNYGGYYQNMFS